MTSYQKMILDCLKAGAVLDCNEGANYKAWLKMPNGELKYVRRDSASKVVSENENRLVFTNDGIKWK